MTDQRHLLRGEDIEQSNCYVVLDEDNPHAAFTLTSLRLRRRLMNINWNSNIEHHGQAQFTIVAEALCRTDHL